MKRCLFLMIALLLAACAPQAPKIPAPPVVDLGPTAYIAPSYPTAEANTLLANQQASGVNVRMDRAWQDGKELNASVCFSLPSDSDWSIWKASLQYAGNVVTDFGTTLESLNAPAEGQQGERCDTLNFFVPPDADLTNASISIDAIAAPPREGEYCDLYLPKIQAALQARGLAIAVECVNQNGVPQMQITSFPPEMSREQAEAVVYSDEFYSIPGPWVFSFSLAPQ